MAGGKTLIRRMVLNQLKARHKTARRGHKLLRRKRDELMRPVYGHHSSEQGAEKG